MNITQTTIDFIRQHARDDVRRLALSAKRTDALDLPFALDQIAGRQMAKTKLPEWFSIAGKAMDESDGAQLLLFPPHISMEQCSSESTARYKRRVLMSALCAAGAALNGLPSDRARSDENACAANGSAAPIPAHFVDVTGECLPAHFVDIIGECLPAHFVDITGGFGVDFSYMARGFEKATYVERQAHLCEIARHNFPLLGLPSAEVLCEELETPLNLPFVNDRNSDLQRTYDGLTTDHDKPSEVPFPGFPLVFFMDPARRDTNGNRTYAIADCTPNVIGFIGDLLEKAVLVMIKLSPMLDWHQTVIDLNRASHSGNAVREVHIVSTQNECKELLIVLSESPFFDRNTPKISEKTAEINKKSAENDENNAKNGQGGNVPNNHGIKVYCVNDDQEFSFSVNDETSHSSLLTPHSSLLTSHSSLLIPNASIMKAGCFEQVETAFGVRQIGRNSHLFVGNEAIEGFPGRIFEVLKITTMNKKELKSALKGIENANIATRNFPLSPEQLRKRLKFKDGGDIYLFATTTDEGEHVIYVCKK